MTSITREAFGLKLSIYEGGQFEKDGKTISFEPGIKLKLGDNDMKLSAMQLAGLFHMMHDDEVLEELKGRYDYEKRNMVSFDVW